MNIVTKIRVKSCPLGYQCLTRTILSWLLKKAVSMALWTKVSLCGKSSLSEQSLPRTPSQPKTSVISVASVAKILRVGVYPEPAEGCLSGIFTTVKSSLQIRLFMQNKAKFLDEQMNVSTIITRGYKNKSRLRPTEKQSQIPKGQNERNFYYNKGI